MFRLEMKIRFHNFTPSPPLSLHKITFCRYLPNYLKICVKRAYNQNICPGLLCPISPCLTMP
ncbi:hypothetical protein NEILACOT_05301 [Neisseria lactamica ATCC 23970]|uniref:Uncharacterized protein n=1 Tax=Neisseria lactamica ATCC 23970 TaxID=546265 RepID=D0WCL9_NEILA|nr:hypothetical protein NEILACOT_05301 [Neisseria lactamica ATCC 23970]